jgi:hypothetical protein
MSSFFQWFFSCKENTIDLSGATPASVPASTPASTSIPEDISGVKAVELSTVTVVSSPECVADCFVESPVVVVPPPECVADCSADSSEPFEDTSEETPEAPEKTPEASEETPEAPEETPEAPEETPSAVASSKEPAKRGRKKKQTV